MTEAVNAERRFNREWLDRIVLKKGSHKAPPPNDGEGEFCAVEAFNYALGCERPGERSDKATPENGLCPVLARAFISFNDRCGVGSKADERRVRVLKPLLIEAVASRSTNEVERRRMWMAADWGLRVAAPKIFALSSLKEWGEKLAALPEVVDEASLGAARSLASSARAAAWSRWNEVFGVFGELRKKAEAAQAAAQAAALSAAQAEAAQAAAQAEAVQAAAQAAAEAAALSAAEAAQAAALSAAAAAANAEGFAKIVAAAQKAHDAGGDYWACRAAARPVAREVMAEWRATRVSILRTIRDELDIEFQALIRRMIAVKAA